MPIAADISHATWPVGLVGVLTELHFVATDRFGTRGT
jgi:hypothetical protein